MLQVSRLTFLTSAVSDEKYSGKKIASVPNLYRLFSLSLFPRQDRVTTIYILFAYQEVLHVEPS